MLDHLKRAFHTFPVFGFVGMKDQDVAPLHVDDLTRILAASATGELAPGTYAPIGPEKLGLSRAVRLVAKVARRRPVFVRLPLWVHYTFAWFAERLMRVPVVSVAAGSYLERGRR